MKNTSTTSRIQKASKPGQLKVRKHNESVIGEEIGGQDLLITSPESHYNKIGDQYLLLENPQAAVLHVRPKKIYHGEAVLTDLTEEQITRMEQAPFKQRDELKRDLFMEDVQRDDSSVKFYTGLSAHDVI